MVRPFVSGNKNDAHDARAIWMAVQQLRLLDPRTGQLLREHLRTPRGWHRIADQDRPARTPAKTLALLAAAKRAGPAIGAAFAPIDGDEVDAAAAGRHQLREVGPEGGVADRRLDADRQPGGRRDGLDEIKQCVRSPEGAVRGGAGAVPIARDAAGLRDLRADLRPRQQAAGAGLGALTQFDLDRANLRTPRDGLLQPRHAEAAVGLTAAEVAGADLPNQYVNNIVEQDHRAIKRRVKAKQGFREFQAARRTIQGYKTMHMIRKAQPHHLASGQPG